jgi:CRISPR-associated protein Cas2
MRNVYLVTYDIRDPKRLRTVFDTMRDWGDHLQLSVFRCILGKRELIELRAALAEIIHHQQDQVLIVNVGPEQGRSRRAFQTIGQPYTHPERHAVVV